MNNIDTCSKCQAPLIAEELETHECCTKTLVDISYDTGTNEYYFFDGRKWYRWFPEWLRKTPTDYQQRNKTTDKSTEPDIIFEST